MYATFIEDFKNTFAKNLKYHLSEKQKLTTTKIEDISWSDISKSWEFPIGEYFTIDSFLNSYDN